MQIRSLDSFIWHSQFILSYYILRLSYAICYTLLLFIWISFTVHSTQFTFLMLTNLTYLIIIPLLTLFITRSLALYDSLFLRMAHLPCLIIIRLTHSTRFHYLPVPYLCHLPGAHLPYLPGAHLPYFPGNCLPYLALPTLTYLAPMCFTYLAINCLTYLGLFWFAFLALICLI